MIAISISDKIAKMFFIRGSENIRLNYQCDYDAQKLTKINEISNTLPVIQVF